jgi:hypothetical protein
MVLSLHMIGCIGFGLHMIGCTKFGFDLSSNYIYYCKKILSSYLYFMI